MRWPRSRLVLRALVVVLALGVSDGCGDRSGPSGGSPPLHDQSASQLARSVREGKIRPSELLELHLERVERLNPALNAIVAFDLDNARRRAAEADRALERGESWGPLHGLPITIKDSFAVVGMPTTSGVPEYASFMASENAVAVQRLIDAGAIVFGKTNLPYLASDWQSYNAIYGTTNNPWNPMTTPGGSSGGAAAAVAAGLSVFELGSDIGGSIRVPAHFTGIYGHKPTFGLVPRDGHFPMFAERPLPDYGMAVAGPLARSADDLELLLEVLSSPRTEAGDAFALPQPRRERLADYRVAAWLTDPRLDTDREVLDVLEGAIEKLREAGVAVDERARPELTLARSYEIYLPILLASLTFDSPPPPALFDEQKRIRTKWMEFFRDHDVVLCPTSQTVAFPHDQSEPLVARTLVVNGLPRPYTENGVWISLATLAGLPATTAPVGISASGLPVGIQIIGPPMGDRTTIDFARRLAGITPGFQPPPLDRPGLHR